MMKKDYRELLSPKNGTWREAIDTYNKFFETDLNEYFETEVEGKFILNGECEDDYFDDYCNQLEIHEKTAPELLDLLEEKYNIGIPTDLRDLYIAHGAFSINDYDSFSISKIEKDRGFFYSEFDNYNYGDTFVEQTDTLSQKQYKTLKERFYFWGIGFFESGASSVMFFYDKEEKCYGEIALLTDDSPLMKSEIFPSLFAGTYAHYSLDEIICRQIDRVLLRDIICNSDLGFITEDCGWDKNHEDLFKNPHLHDHFLQEFI